MHCSSVALVAFFLSFGPADSFVHRKRRGATTSASCTGVHGEKQHLEVWIYDNWQYQCDNGRTKVVGCIATPRGEKRTISVNSSITVNGFWHNCTEIGNNVKYSEEASCIAEGKDVHINESFSLGNFKMRCREYGYDIAGCNYNSSDGSTKDMSVGTENFVDGKFIYNCTKDQSGTVRFSMASNGCEEGGIFHKNGESWRNQNFKFQCDQGNTRISHCLAGDVEIEVGKTETVGGTTRQCFRQGNSVHFYSGGQSGCDPADPNCHSTTPTQPNDQSSSQVPTQTGGQPQLLLNVGTSRRISTSFVNSQQPGEQTISFTVPIGSEQNVGFHQLGTAKEQHN